MPVLYDGLSAVPPGLQRAAGIAGAMRYLRPDVNGRNHPWALTAQELEGNLAGGQEVGVVWENAGQAPLNGYQQGVGDARQANDHADRIGWPADRPVFYAVDFQVVASQWAAVAAYFAGVGSVGRRPVGCYGGYDTVEYAASHGLARWHWQTEAWSAGRVSAHACLLQTIRARAVIPGVSIDTNVVLLPDRGTFSRANPPAPAPHPVHVTAPPGTPPLKPGDFGFKIAQLQVALNYGTGSLLAGNSSYDAATEQAVTNLQRWTHIGVDGVYGPQSQWVLQVACNNHHG